jgi:LPS sulfotransferase NodH
VESLDEYLACVRSVGTTENGVFASSVMWPRFSSLLERLCASGQRVDGVLPRLRFVFLWREDVVGQAVSWSRAAQRQASGNLASWRTWFAANDVEPLSIRFEDLVADKEAVVRRVLSLLDIDLPEGVEIAERTVRASDDASAGWAERYRALRPVRESSSR